MTAIKPPTRLLDSLGMIKSMETLLLTAPRMHISGTKVVLIPAENADAWITFLGRLATATEARQTKEKKNGKDT